MDRTRKAKSTVLIEEYDDAYEVYPCYFCDYASCNYSKIEDHYYFNHAKDLEDFPGDYLNRKIDLMIINSDKAYFEWIYPEFCKKVTEMRRREGNIS